MLTELFFKLFIKDYSLNVQGSDALTAETMVGSIFRNFPMVRLRFCKNNTCLLILEYYSVSYFFKFIF